jgi:multicomponent Na+:H+ antiporter subunit D
VHSVGAVHTGTFAILKLIAYLYGHKYMSLLSASFWKTGWIMYLCGYTAIYSAVRAYLTTDLKKRFSYSTVGQLSYVITAGLVGTSQALLGGVLHIISHSVAKMTLFFIAGTFNSVYGTVDAREVAKIAPHMRWIVVIVAICGLSITGFPLLAGYYSKDLILLEEIHQHHYAAAGFLVMGSVLNFLYIFPVLKAAVMGKKIEAFKVKPVPRSMMTALVISAVLMIVLSSLMPYISELLAHV